MDTEFAITWFLAIAPLSFSPGPANILFAASGSIFGVKASLPFWIGTNLICLLQTVVVGLGLATVITESSEIQTVFKFAGVLVLLYLASRFFRSKIRGRQVLKPLTLKDGMLVELVNAKFLLIPTMMFSLFYIPTQNLYWYVIGLTTALVLMTMIANFVWIIGGKAAISAIENDRFTKFQGLFFGTVLTLTAFWFAIR